MSESPSSTPGRLPVPDRLKHLLEAAKQPALSARQLELFSAYYSLIIRWNLRMNLTAIRTEEGILSRHFVESIACARALPNGIASLLDFGSGAGFPGIPIAICRPEIAVTLAESQGKKAAFLHEAVRTLDLTTTVHHGRAEELVADFDAGFDCVVLRAVDQMADAITGAAGLVRLNGLLAIMTTEAEIPRFRAAAGPEFSWLDPIRLPGERQFCLDFGKRGEIVT